MTSLDPNRLSYGQTAIIIMVNKRPNLVVIVDLFTLRHTPLFTMKVLNLQWIINLDLS